MISDFEPKILNFMAGIIYESWAGDRIPRPYPYFENMMKKIMIIMIELKI